MRMATIAAVAALLAAPALAQTATDQGSAVTGNPTGAQDGVRGSPGIGSQGITQPSMSGGNNMGGGTGGQQQGGGMTGSSSTLGGGTTGGGAGGAADITARPRTGGSSPATGAGDMNTGSRSTETR